MKAFIIFLFFTACLRQGAPNEQKTDAPPLPGPELVSIDTIRSITIDYDTTKWMELTDDMGFILDIKYATPDNFVKEVIYPCGRCFLRKEAAEALIAVKEHVKNQGYKVRLLDCYRPSPAQEKLWAKVPDPNYVAHPSEGSMHSRGVAVDLTFTDRAGKEIDMGTPYDFFGKEAHHDYKHPDSHILGQRSHLKKVMEMFGFQSIRTEWWHYSLDGHFPPLSDWQWKCN
jgi:D-alanyl-D-alanine dipeptidase